MISKLNVLIRALRTAYQSMRVAAQVIGGGMESGGSGKAVARLRDSSAHLLIHSL